MLERFYVPTGDLVRVSEQALRTTVAAIFEGVGVPPEDAAEGAEVLVASDLRGVESHGVSNMLRNYVHVVPQRAAQPDARMEDPVRETPATAHHRRRPWTRRDPGAAERCGWRSRRRARLASVS